LYGKFYHIKCAPPFTDAKPKNFNKAMIVQCTFVVFSKDEMKSDDSDEEAENEAVQSSSAPGKSPKIPKHDLTMTDEVSYHVAVSFGHPYLIRIGL